MRFKLPPVVFIHYGINDYLNYTLPLARAFNPDRVVLLGDEANAHMAKLVNYYVPYAVIAEEQDGRVAQFRKVFRHISTLPRVKIYFEFLRWFLLLGFMEREGVEWCWYFDSDTAICAELSSEIHQRVMVGGYPMGVVNYFGGCVCFVNGQEALRQWCELCIELFQDREYFSRHQWVLEEHKHKGLHYSLCDMQLFAEFQRRVSPLYEFTKIVEGCTFDPNINLDRADQLEREPVWEMTPRGCKKIYWKQGFPYCKHLPTGKLVRMLTLNLSWTPLEFKRVIHDVLMWTLRRRQE